jgi:hypothetical protein
MNDSDDPKDQEGLEKHIKLDWEEAAKPNSPEPEPVTPSFAPLQFERGPIRQFYQDLLDSLTEPTYFFKERYPKISLSYAIAFGIIVKWIASFLDWLTRAVRHETLMDGFMKMRDKLQELPMWKNLPDNFWAQGTDHAASASNSLFPAWLAEMLSIALSPFQSLIHFCISGFIFFLGAYCLIPKKEGSEQDPIEISQFIKLACLTSAPYLVASILGFLPLSMGSLIGSIYSCALLIVGMSIRFKISNLRAVAIMTLPGIVCFIAVMAFLLVLGVLGFLMFSALFHS